VFGGFKPSRASDVDFYNAEGELTRYQIDKNENNNPGIGKAHSLYQTQAEQMDAIAPFLRINKSIDEMRRNYVILPGGAAAYRNGHVEQMSPEVKMQNIVSGSRT
jgi:hypothetical protein